MIPIVTRDELNEKMARGDAFVLFEVLGRPYFRKHHLPGAIHMPPDRVHETVEEFAPNRDTEIIVYCWDDG